MTVSANMSAIILYNILSAYLRSLGDSITPVIFLIIAAVLNIGLDLFFIINLHWGVFGAAFATAIGSVVLQAAVNTLGSGAVAAMTAGSFILLL